VLPAIASYV